jgi:hypothetical protein
MGGLHLAIDEVDVPSDELFDERDESDLGSVAGLREHGLAEEDAAE